VVGVRVCQNDARDCRWINPDQGKCRTPCRFARWVVYPRVDHRPAVAVAQHIAVYDLQREWERQLHLKDIFGDLHE
jgi:hypothetical protein